MRMTYNYGLKLIRYKYKCIKWIVDLNICRFKHIITEWILWSVVNQVCMD